MGQIAREAARHVPPALVRGFGRPAALFFHGVESGTLDGRVQTNHHESAEFREICRTLKANFEVLPLAALPEALKHPRLYRRAVFLMSDDGYANSLAVSADILAEFHLPWSLFVSTHHIDTGARNPVFLIRLFFAYAPDGAYEVPHLEPFVLGATGRMALAQAAIDRLRYLDFARADEAVRAMGAAFAPAALAELLDRFASEKFLDWNGVRALAGRGVAIGAHAHHHWPMHAGQTRAYLRAEAEAPRARLSAELGECRFFSYPFGNTRDVSRAAWESVRDAGYDFAFTTLSGSLDGGANPWLLPRFAIPRRERRLASLVPLLRFGNRRLANWQKRVG